MRKPTVLDASVAAKLVFKEDDSPQAIHFVETAESFIAPEIMRLEVSGAIIKKLRAKEITAEAAEICYKCWSDVALQPRFTFYNDEELRGEAFALSVQARHPLYDCLYVALARTMDTHMVTADHRLIETLGDCGVEIRHLRDAG